MTARPIRRRPQPAFEPHAHDPAPDEPPAFNGSQVCRACGKTGRVGDAQHPLAAPALGTRPMPPAPQAALDLDARILGEAQ